MTCKRRALPRWPRQLTVLKSGAGTTIEPFIAEPGWIGMFHDTQGNWVGLPEPSIRRLHTFLTRWLAAYGARKERK